MKISTVIEQPDGNYTFQAELTPDQHAFLIEFAVRELIRAGLVPFASTATAAEKASLIPVAQQERPH